MYEGHAQSNLKRRLGWNLNSASAFGSPQYDQFNGSANGTGTYSCRED